MARRSRPVPVAHARARAAAQTRTLDLYGGLGSSYISAPSASSAFSQAWERKQLIKDVDREGFTAVAISTAASDVADTTNIPLVAVNAATGDRVDDDWVCKAFNRGMHPEVGAGEGRQHIVAMLAYAGAAPLLVDVKSGTFTPLVGVIVELLAPDEATRALRRVGHRKPDVPRFNRDGTPRFVGAYRILNAAGTEIGVYRVDEGKLVLPRLPHPSDIRVSQPLIAQVGMSIDIMYDKRFAVRTLLRNGGAPAGFLKISADLDERKLEAFSRSLNRKITSPDRRGRWVAVQADLVEPVPLDGGKTAPGANWKEFSDAERAVIQSCIGIPDARLPGYLGGKTFENQRVELGQWYASGIRQYLAPIEDALNLWANNAAAGLLYEFDTSQHPALREDRTAQLERAIRGWDAGLLDMYEARTEAGLPAEDDMAGIFKADVEAAVAAPITVTEPAPAPEPTPEPEADVEPDIDETDTDERAAVTRDIVAPSRRDVPNADELTRIINAAIDDAAGTLGGYAAGYHERIARNIEGAIRRLGLDVTVDDMLDVARRNAELVQDLPAVLASIGRPLADVALATTAQAAGTVVPALPADILEQVTTARVQQLIDGNSTYAGWNATIRADLADAIRTNIAEGGGPDELAARVRKTVTGVDDARATVIARTETNSLYSELSKQTAERSGVVKTKTWYSINDDRTRPAHSAIAGTTIDIDAQFDVEGTQAWGPHDANLPADQVVQCRCRLLYGI